MATCDEMTAAFKSALDHPCVGNLLMQACTRNLLPAHLQFQYRVLPTAGVTNTVQEGTCAGNARQMQGSAHACQT